MNITPKLVLQRLVRAAAPRPVSRVQKLPTLSMSASLMVYNAAFLLYFIAMLVLVAWSTRPGMHGALIILVVDILLAAAVSAFTTWQAFVVRQMSWRWAITKSYYGGSAVAVGIFNLGCVIAMAALVAAATTSN